MKIFLPVLFLAIVNKLIEHEFGKDSKYLAEIVTCTLIIIYAIKYNTYIINCVYIIILLSLDYIVFPFLTLLAKKNPYFQNRKKMQTYEKKIFLYWLSIIDIAFIVCVNIKICGCYFAVNNIVKNSILKECLSVSNLRYIYNLFIILLLIYIIKTAWKLKSK